jgi:O-antigen/teichoic acid export membrane protein
MAASRLVLATQKPGNVTGHTTRIGGISAPATIAAPEDVRPDPGVSSDGRLRAAGGYTLAMYVLRVSSIVKNLLLASFLGPGEFGLVAAFMAFLSYSAYLDVGVLHAVYREVPMLRGAGERKRVERTIDAAYGGSIFLGACAAAVLLLVALLQATHAVPLPGKWWFSLGLAMAVFAQQLAGLAYNVALGEGRLVVLARALSVAAVCDVAASVGAGVAWGAFGAVLVGSVGLLVQYLLVLSQLRPRPRPRRDVSETLRLARVGIPIALIWLGNTNFIAMDKLVALVGLGHTSLGLYSLASAGTGLVMVGPVAMATLFGPRILRRLGEAAGGARAMAATTTAVGVAGVAAGVLVAVGVVAAPAVTKTFLPEYVSAVRAAQILLVGGGVLATAFPLAAYLIGRGVQWHVVRIYAFGSVLNLALDAVLLSLGFGITGIAAGSLVAYVAFSLAMHRLIAGVEGSRWLSARLVRSFLPLAIGSVVGGVISLLLHLVGDASRLAPAAAGSVVAFVLVAGASLAYTGLGARIFRA